MENEYYKPKLINNIRIDGITAETIPNGETGKIFSRKFISSVTDPNFRLVFNNIINIFCNSNAGDYLNQLLVIIKPNNTAYVYEKFPVSIGIKAAKSLKKLQPVFKGDFSDITKISFKDDVIDLNPSKEDQVIWIFRHNWIFGLYFDFSKQLDTETTLQTLGMFYKKTLYFDMYSFLSSQNNFDQLVSDGWFPFFLLLDGKFEELIKYYSEEKKFNSYIESILISFSEEKLKEVTGNWWNNSILINKKEIIESAINAYNAKDYVNCIKNLSSEVEGIIRYALFRDTGNKKPTTKQLKEYVVSSGEGKFNTQNSLGFPSEFMRYLDDSIFKDFDIDNDITTSRHSVSHGVAIKANYTQERALQFILTIDQICRFIQ